MRLHRGEECRALEELADDRRGFLRRFAAIVVRLDSLQERAEVRREREGGARATQKILVPLAFFIFPAVLIVIMGPVALQFLK